MRGASDFDDEENDQEQGQQPDHLMLLEEQRKRNVELMVGRYERNECLWTGQKRVVEVVEVKKLTPEEKAERERARQRRQAQAKRDARKKLLAERMARRQTIPSAVATVAVQALMRAMSAG
jgi:hypothetical protein